MNLVINTLGHSRPNWHGRAGGHPFGPFGTKLK